MPRLFGRSKYLGHMASPKDRNAFYRALTLLDTSYHGAILATHEFADADGIGTIFAMNSYLRREHPASRLTIALDNIAMSGRGLIEELGIESVSWREIPHSDMRPLIIVDTSTPALLNGVKERRNEILLNIDHHKQAGPIIQSRFGIINDDAISASEVTASLIQKKKIDKDMALALAVGIAADTERLRYANAQSITIFDELMSRSGKTKMQIDDLACPGNDPKTVLAILDEMRDNILLRENYKGRSVVIAMTDLDIPAILSDAFRDLQVSVAVGLKSVDGRLHKMSIRIVLREALRNRIHANDIARDVGARFGAHPESGGGHIDKGGAMLVGDTLELAEAIAEAIRHEIDSKTTHS